jgi:hypothetical protein
MYFLFHQHFMFLVTELAPPVSYRPVKVYGKFQFYETSPYLVIA